jgi:integrase
MLDEGIDPRKVGIVKRAGIEAPTERALSESELKAFLLNRMRICRTRRGGYILMTLLLTMQRRQELALVTKTDFDLDNRTWSIPDDQGVISAMAIRSA